MEGWEQRQGARQEQLRAKSQEKKRVHRKKEAELVAMGKKPFFLKRSARKLLQHKEKFEELAREGKVERAIEKRRKRLAAKDHGEPSLSLSLSFSFSLS